MPITNRPSDADDYRDVPWTPAIGLRNAALRGGLVALLLAGLLVPASIYLPYMTIPWLLRGPLTVGIAWLMFKVVQDAAGMAGPACTALALALTAGVLVSQHLVFAACGVLDLGSTDWWSFPAGVLRLLIPPDGGLLIGSGWLHAYVVAAVNLPPLIVAGSLAAALWGR